LVPMIMTLSIKNFNSSYPKMVQPHSVILLVNPTRL